MIVFENKEEAQAENIRKMILAMSHDMRVLMVKLADRLHNMSTLDFQKPHKQRRIAQETMDIYAPLANRLGLYLLKRQLEDLSFKYLRPDIYNQIDHWLDAHQVVEKQIIEKVVSLIQDLLASNGLEGQVYGRIKHKYSIYKKMQSQSLTLDEMHDIMAFRVLVKDIRDCYAVLGLVHSQWKPVHGRFKDYISMPKANGYQSLHTTVIGPEGERIEIQIRTEEMHRQAEHGVAAHWLYKEKGRVNSKDLEQFSWLREIFERQGDEADSREFMHSLKLDLFKDEVYVYTPAGDVKELPEGATPLDFAFHIHSKVGHHCAGAKINGRLMPLGTPLKNGDIVEIITDPSRNPNRDWLKIVKTAKARSKIKAFIREEQAKSARLGREELERKLKNWKFGLTIDEAVGYLCKYYKLKAGTELYGLIATEKIDLSTVKEILTRWQSGEADEERRAAAAAAEQAKLQNAAARPAHSTDALVIDDNINQIEYKLAKCCNPIKGDDIFGFVTISSGITIHRTDCPNARRMRENYPYRVIDARWRQTAEGAFRVTIRIVAADTTGMANHITETVIRDLKLNIRSMNLASRGGLLTGTVDVEVPATSVVDTLVHAILRIKGVQKAFRTNG